MSVQTMRPTLLNRRGKLTFKHLRISSSPPILLLFIMFETPGLFLSFLLFSPDRFQFTAFSRHAALLLPTTRGGRNLTARNLRGLIHILFFFFISQNSTHPPETATENIIPFATVTPPGPASFINYFFFISTILSSTHLHHMISDGRGSRVILEWFPSTLFPSSILTLSQSPVSPFYPFFFLLGTIPPHGGCERNPAVGPIELVDGMHIIRNLNSISLTLSGHCIRPVADSSLPTTPPFFPFNS